MRLAITGASGFVGRYTVAAAIEAGHTVRALIRPAGTADTLGRYAGHPAMEQVRADLRSPAGLDDVVDGVDAVIHLAAAKAGDFPTQFTGTVVATENLLAAMARRGVGSLVGVSTLAVYDYLAIRRCELVTEDSPVDETPGRRDEYARTKLIQDKLFRRFGHHAPGAHRVVIVRPGMIYGRDNLWHALLGTQLGSRFVKIGTSATLPLIYVENCAEGLVAAAEALTSEASTVCGQVINIVDDDLPTQRSYASTVAAVVDTPPSMTLPWPIVDAATTVLDRANDLLLGGRAEFPGIIVPDRLHARFKPLRYSNAKAKRLLGWKPSFDLHTAIERSTGPDAVLTAPGGTSRD